MKDTKFNSIKITLIGFLALTWCCPACVCRAGPLLCWIAILWWLWWEWWPGGGAAKPWPRTISDSGLRRILDWTRLKCRIYNYRKILTPLIYQQHAATEMMRTLLVIVVNTTTTLLLWQQQHWNCGQHHLWCLLPLLLLLPLSSYCQQFYYLFNLKHFISRWQIYVAVDC